jgi:hypothetical protein
VSRYLPAPGRRPRQSWRSFFRNQTIAFSHHQYPEEQSDREYPCPQVWSYWGRLVQFVAALIATVCACLSRWLDYQLPTLNARRTCLLSGRRDRGVMHLARRVAAVPGRAWKARGNRRQAAVPMRSPPYEARASPPLRPRATQDLMLAHSRAGFRHAVYEPLRLTLRTHRRHAEPFGRHHHGSPITDEPFAFPHARIKF